MHMIISLATVSVIFQIVAIIIVLRLIPLTHKKAWWFMVIALFLILIRRIDSLLNVIDIHNTNIIHKNDLIFYPYEFIGMLISFCLMVGSYYMTRIFKDLKDTNLKIKVLKGLLPICSSCKRIRDINTGEWNQMEYYIHTHSEAEFTHGICPSCAIKLYPQYFNKENIK